MTQEAGVFYMTSRNKVQNRKHRANESLFLHERATTDEPAIVIVYCA